MAYHLVYDKIADFRGLSARTVADTAHSEKAGWVVCVCPRGESALVSDLAIGEMIAAKVSLATVYQKHSSLLTRKRMYRG